MRRFFGILAAFAGMLLASATPAFAADACNERCLLQIASQYMDGLTANDPSTVPMGAGARTTENGVVTPLTAGIWKTANGWGYRHTMVDTTSGEIGVFGAVNEGADVPVMLGIRLKVTNHKIAESELLVSRKGDFSLFNPTWAVEPKLMFKEFVPVERRSTRAELAQIPVRYFGAISQGKPSLIDVHPDAIRVENGIQTTSQGKLGSSSISEGLHRFIYMKTVKSLRTPVIDEQRGLVLAVAAIDMPPIEKTIMVRGKPIEITSAKHNLPRTLFLYELFKVDNGLVVGIEAVLRNAPLGTDIGWPNK